MTADGFFRPDWISVSEKLSPPLHGFGVLASVTALILRDVTDPAIGFPIAIGLLTGVGLLSSSPSTERPAVLRVISGGPTSGGKKQGATIKLVFAIALLYASTYPTLFGSGPPVPTDLLLGLALLSSSIGTTLEAKAIDNRLESTDTVSE